MRPTDMSTLPTMPFRASGTVIWRCAAALGLAAALAWAFRQGFDVDADGVRDRLLDLGAFGPIVYVGVYALQVVVAPIPGLPIGAAAGFVFGLAPALLYGTVGLAIGTLVALVSGRLWGRRVLARVAGPGVLARWERLRVVDSPLTWLAIFLGPSPDLVLFVAGMSRIPLPRLFVIAMVGRAPAMATATLLGAGLVGLGPWLIVGAGGAGALFWLGGMLLRRALPEAAAA
jgi:uncharacterized membrane protein YdjX (TVP38/TMEM64 family)